MFVAQLLLVVVLVVLSLGPVGHYLNLSVGGPDLFVVIGWVLAWFAPRETSIRWALLAGLSLDALTYLPFGVWTISLLMIVLLIDYSRRQYLEPSSLIHAVVSLIFGTLISNLFLAAVTVNWDWLLVAVNLIGNLLIGLIIYYLAAVRFKFIQQWAGQRLASF